MPSGICFGSPLGSLLSDGKPKCAATLCRYRRIIGLPSKANKARIGYAGYDGVNGIACPVVFNEMRTD